VETASLDTVLVIQSEYTAVSLKYTIMVILTFCLWMTQTFRNTSWVNNSRFLIPLLQTMVCLHSSRRILHCIISTEQLPTIYKERLLLNLNQPSLVWVYDASGRLAYNSRKKVEEIDMHLPAGVYFIKTTSDYGNQSGKFIIVK
jgi:hypothetical protein